MSKKTDEHYAEVERLEQLYAPIVDWLCTLPCLASDGRDLEVEFVHAAETVVKQPYFDPSDLMSVLVSHWWDMACGPESYEELKGYVRIAAEMRRNAEARGQVR